MKPLTVALLLIIEALFGFWVGVNTERLRELKKWSKAMDALDVEKAGWRFTHGFLWAYDRVVKGIDDASWRKTNDL